ncbi:MAG: cation:proton antiporter [Sphingobium sp.]|jgi:CPA2 family monovalent cation:H+ antiporter-2|nr:cation:proton antiporter [Sphingobium sp.]MCI1272100.1 cation:proton antiporter [Sphingobium sp.]MCI1755030.1 cation:proton antiporter [Sphingobium sp.]MCI2051783.1 cation:proton antiporter [Sphingobium sp.]
MALEIHSTSGLSDTLVILGAAGVVIPTFARFRISPVIGFILAGIIVGPSGLGAMTQQFPWLEYATISRPEAIAPFAELGIILLLFSIGLELSFKRLWSMRRLVFGVGALELGGSALLIAGALYLMGNHSAAAIGIGLALALSSTALVLPIAGTQSAVGSAAFSMLLFEDLALVPIIFLLGAIAPGSGGDSFGIMMNTLLFGGAAVIAMLLAGPFILPRIFAQAARTKSPEVFLAASLLVVIMASLATALTGLSPIVGALLAGLLIAETDYHGEVESITAPFRGLALGVFLLTVGMSLDLGFIAERWPSLLLAVGGVVVIKTLVTAFLLRLYGARRSIAAEVGILMSSPSETTLIVLSAASAAHIINEYAAMFWQIATAIGLTLTPLLAQLGHALARRIEQRSYASSAGEAPIQPEGESAGRTVILGFGRVGRMVCDLLRSHDQPYVAVDSDPDIVIGGRKDGYMIRFGNVTRPQTLDHLALEKAKVLVLTMDDPVLCVKIVRAARQSFPDLPIIARARDTAHASQLYRAGVTEAVPETLESSLQLAETALVELGVAMGPVIASIHQQREDLRQDIKRAAKLDHVPRLRQLRSGDEKPA